VIRDGELLAIGGSRNHTLPVNPVKVGSKSDSSDEELISVG
jgi:hypothetical protein